MIDTLMNLLFRCSHRRLTRPITPVNRSGVPAGGTYVVCLDCAKQFPYDMKEMRMGRAIERTHEAAVVDPRTPTPRKTKLKYALWASVPAALLAGLMLKNNNKKKPGPTQPK